MYFIVESKTVTRQCLGILIPLASLGLTLPLLVGCAGSEPVMTPSLPYPETRVVDQVDVYHGVEVRDPHRWLEEDSPQTQAFVEAQDRLLTDYVGHAGEGAPGRAPDFADLLERCREIREVPSISPPIRRGELFFAAQGDPGSIHGRLTVRRGVDGEVFDLLDFAEVIDGPKRRQSGFTVSHDGRYVAWASLDPGGWGNLGVAEIRFDPRGMARGDGEASALVLADRIDGVAGASAIWSRDGSGFFYLHYGKSEELIAGEAEPSSSIRYHVLGADPAEDPVVYARPDRPAMLYTPKLSDDGRYLVVGLNDGSRTRTGMVYFDLQDFDPATPPTARELVPESDGVIFFEGNRGRRFFLQTDIDAPRRRVVEMDLDNPAPVHWRDVIPEREMALSSVSHIGGRLVARLTEHARPVIEVWSLEGVLERTLELPAIGLVSGLADDPEGKVAFYRMNSLIDPGTIYRVDLDSGLSEVHERRELGHDPADFEIRQVFYPARDGVRIPMFLAHKKEVPLRSERPLYLYGYGHGGWVAFPWFQPHLVAWMELGGVYALPGLRGGGEYGAEWQAAGTRHGKPTTIADYLDAAEWLIENGYTRADLLVANGGSASGVVPAAAAVARPELFGAVVIDFPFLDMLRYHRFTSVKGWTEGYGSAEDPEDFETLFAYSPLHNLKSDVCYPSTLTLVGDKDTLTVPMHGYKFTAALQAVQACERPILLKNIAGAGHYSYGTDPPSAAETEAQILAFLVRSLDFDGWG